MGWIESSAGTELREAKVSIELRFKMNVLLNLFLPGHRESRPHAGRRAGIVAQRSRRNRRGRGGRSAPRNLGEIEEFEQVGLRVVARRQVGRAVDESAFDELDHRGVI